MPNILPKGLWGRPGSTPGAGLPASEIGATLLGETTTRVADQVWVGADDGTPVIIWSVTAGSPASATAVYSPTQVDLAWVPSDPQIAESYNIRRPDGSLAGNVSAPATTFTDSNPRPLNGAYTVYGVLGGVQSSVGTATNSLDLRLQPATATTTVNDNGTATSSVVVAWTHNALGRPDSYAIYRGGALLTTVAGTVLSLNDPNPIRGDVRTYEVRPVLSTIEGLGRSAAATSVGAMPPTSVALTALNPPLSTLRLSWAHPGGARTGYEVQRYVSSTSGPWTAHAMPASSATSSDWSTTLAGYMRVRTLSAGGPSVYVQAGPTQPINDVTPPANAVINSFQPESSYGRLVLRFTTPNDTDFAQYLVQSSPTGADPWTNVTGWTSAARNTAYAVVIGTFAAGTNMRARVLVRDNAVPTPNQRVGGAVSRLLVASPTIIDTSGDDSGTYRAGAWRNDATRSTQKLATGWTSSGHNIGCYFYGTTVSTALANKTLVSGTIEYYRENEGGLGAGVQPLFWTHALTGRTGAPAPNAQGVAEASRLGTAVARTGTTGGTFNLPAAFLAALKAGTARGLCMYRGYQGSGDPDSYYALLGIGGVTGGSPSKVNGRLRINHLG